MEEIKTRITKLIDEIDSLRTDLDNTESNSDEEAEWHDNIGANLVDAQDALRQANQAVDDGPDEAGEEEPTDN